jgi:hypothetical protein
MKTPRKKPHTFSMSFRKRLKLQVQAARLHKEST